MGRLIIRRLLGAVPLLTVITFLAFSLLLLVPGDAAIVAAGEDPTVAEIEAARQRLGLDRSIPVQYGSWLGNVVQGDLGTSLFSSRPVTETVLSRLPVTSSLILVAMSIGVVAGIAAGLVAALNSGKLTDRWMTVMASLGVAMPHFWIGLLLIAFVSIRMGWLPPGDYVPLHEGVWGWLSHLILPGLALSASVMAEVARQTRAGVIDVMHKPYVRAAAAKGLRRATVIRKHVAKNAAIAVITVIGLQLSRLLGSAVIIESIFGLPGMGRLVVQSVFQRDLPIVQGVILVSAVLVVTSNLIVDIAYGYFNPKIRQA